MKWLKNILNSIWPRRSSRARPPLHNEFDALEKKIGQLETEACIALVASCAERAMPYYDEFRRAYAWDQQGKLREILNRVWAVCPEYMSVGDSDVASLIESCHALIPFSGDYPENEILIQAAPSITRRAWEVMKQSSHRPAWKAVTESLDIADQIALDDLMPDATVMMNEQLQEADQAVAVHPAMVAELQRLNADLDALMGMPITEASMRAFRERSRP